MEAAPETARTSKARPLTRSVADPVSDNAAGLHRRVAALHAELAEAQAQIARLEEESENEAGRLGEMLSRVAEAEREARAEGERAKAAELALVDARGRVEAAERGAQEELEVSRSRLADTQKWLDAERLLKEEMREARDDERRRAEFAQTAQKLQIDRLTEELALERAGAADVRRAATESQVLASGLRSELEALKEELSDSMDKARTAVEVELVLSHDRALEDLRASQSRDLALIGEQHERAMLELRTAHEAANRALQTRLDATDSQLSGRSRALAAAETRMEEVARELSAARGEQEELAETLAQTRRAKETVEAELASLRLRMAASTAIVESLGRSEQLITAADESLAELDKRELETARARAKAFGQVRKLIVAVEDLRRKGEPEQS